MVRIFDLLPPKVRIVWYSRERVVDQGLLARFAVVHRLDPLSCEGCGPGQSTLAGMASER